MTPYDYEDSDEPITREELGVVVNATKCPRCGGTIYHDAEGNPFGHACIIDAPEEL